MTLHDLTRPELAALAREWLLAGHLIDRAGMPQVIAAHDREVMEAVAIEEWMAASPIYTRRMQQALGFAGDDVTTIFKGMQLDIGAPPGFMDFRYTVQDPHHGEFQLAHCGALLDVEPMGDEFVTGMCHHIEDPTFDATAAATNPHARVRPIHRPPRVPADRHPHCHWTVAIDPGNDPLPEPAPALALARSRLAGVALTPITDDGEGRTRYDGALEPDLQLERFSRAALVRICEEVALQGQLLARAFMVALAHRFGSDTARDLGARQLAGSAGITSQRLARHLGVSGGPGAIASVLRLHPALHPVPCVEVALGGDDNELVVEVRAPAELTDDDRLSWPALIVEGAERAMTAAVQGADPRARAHLVERSATRAVWSVRLAAEPAPALDEVVLASFSQGATFELRSPRAMRPGGEAAKSGDAEGV